MAAASGEPEVVVPAPRNEAQELYESALSAPRDEAVEQLRSLEANHPDALAESGIPLLPLVVWTQLRKRGRS